MKIDKLKKKAYALSKKISSYLEERSKKAFEEYNIVDGDTEEISELKVLLLVVKTRFLPIALAFLITFACCGSIFYWQSFGEASSIMLLNYEESTKGLYPNGSRFNMYSIHSDEVMEKAIEMAGIQGVIKPAELARSITISPVITRSSDTEMFMATSYWISFKKPKQIRDISTSNMMDIISKAYVSYFMENYAYNISFVKTDIINDDSVEYKELREQVVTKISEMSNLMLQRTIAAPSFRSKKTGYSFREISQMLTNLSNQQLEIFSSYISRNGVAKNKMNSINTTSYLNKLLENKRDRNQKEYNLRTRAIEIYNRAIVESVLIPTIDKSGQFYMSRTKIGIDDITTDAENFLSDATQYQVAIDQNNEYMANVYQHFYENYVPQADKYAANVLSELDRIENLIVRTDAEYIAEKTKSYLTFKEKVLPYSYRFRFKLSTLFALLITAIMFCFYYSEVKRIIADRRNEE